MNHMAGPGHAVKPALGQFAVQTFRLRISVNQPVLVTGNDDDRHLQICVLVAELKCVRNQPAVFGFHGSTSATTR